MNLYDVLGNPMPAHTWEEVPGLKPLREKFILTRSKITNNHSRSLYWYVGRDSKTVDGFNPSCNIFDEAAAMTDHKLAGALVSGQAARAERYNFRLTTAQDNKSTQWYEARERLCKILDPTIKHQSAKEKAEEERIFGVLYHLEDDENYNDEAIWIKANPNLGVSATVDFIRGRVQAGRSNPSELADVRLKNFNQYVASSTSWLDVEVWQNVMNIVHKVREEGELFVAFDMGMTDDLAARAAMWKVNAGDRYEYHFDIKCFTPRHTYESLPAYEKKEYDKGIKNGSLVVTDGNNGKVVDYDVIASDVLSLMRRDNFVAFGYDAYGALELLDRLESAIEDVGDKTLEKVRSRHRSGEAILQIGQSMAHLSAPTKQFEVALHAGAIRHEGDPFIAWQFANCHVFVDVQDNIKVRKGDDPRAKIDGIIAAIMAVAMGYKAEKPSAPPRIG